MRWTQADLAQLQGKSAAQIKHQYGQKGSKYGNETVVIDSFRFDSQLEGRLYSQLKLQKQAGDLRPPYFLMQTPFHLPGNVKYRVDFMVFPILGGCEYLDAKGMLTPLSALKIKQVEDLYGVKIKLWSDRR